jgi:hypothetical protein
MLSLDPVRLGIAAGMVLGMALFIGTLLSIASGIGSDYLEQVGRFFPGYTVSVSGSFVGLIYGFIKGFFGLFLLAYIYNVLGPKNSV